MRPDRRTLLWTVLLLIPPAAFYVPLERIAYLPFLIASMAVFLVSVILYHRARKRSDVSLETFLSVQFIGLILGQVESLMGVLLFILLAGVLTAWLPDSISDGEPLKTAGTILYTLSVLLLTYWLVEPVPGKTKNRELKRTKYLVTALSMPNWNAGIVLNANCEKLRRNSAELNENERRQNIVPLFQAVSYHLPKLERVYLLVSKSILEWGGNVSFEEDYLKERGINTGRSPFETKFKAFLTKLSECIRRPILVRWSDGRRESLGSGEGVIEFILVSAGDFNDIEECRDAIKEAVGGHIEEESWEVTFDITGGKTLVSAAMVLEAIKGDCQAEYTRQDVQDVEPEESLYRVDLDVHSLKDLLNEVARNLNRRL
ncbi:hypothetical protein FH039_08690 [Thermococcus indicus]|uniref:Uncharacterized protein n=1 Tax=Thermococcus indicus TaxID=2586643 RepID=A0A4Y5SN94_9EURY|nr:hypothetical protein [Thermococcus indicus]QDA31659.1 hypothetical protein FH039_08690 [Thermococcus indicus]